MFGRRHTSCGIKPRKNYLALEVMLRLKSMEIWKEGPDYGIDPAYSADNSVIGCGAKVAVQQRLGLWTKRRTGFAVGDCADSAITKSVLTQDASRPFEFKACTMMRRYSGSGDHPGGSPCSRAGS